MTATGPPSRWAASTCPTGDCYEVTSDYGDCLAEDTGKKCGAGPFLRTRGVQYHGFHSSGFPRKDEQDCGRHAAAAACRGDSGGCLWDPRAQVCNNRNVVATTVGAKTYYDRKPVWRKSCEGAGACRWLLGPASSCKANTGYRNVCGKSERTRTVTCSGGKDAAAECAANAGCGSRSDAECRASDQCRWDGRVCRDHTHGAVLKLPCQSQCPFSVVKNSPDAEIYYVLTPDTSKAVKDLSSSSPPTSGTAISGTT